MHICLVCQAWVTEVHVVIYTSRYEILPLGFDDMVGSDAVEVVATDDGGYAVVFDEYATYVLFAFIDDGGLVYQSGNKMNLNYD